MERDQLLQLLVGDDEASKAALAALAEGDDFVVWEDGTLSSETQARRYANRRGSLRRRGIETLGLERAVQLFRERDQPLRLGKITSVDRSRVFMLFLTEDGSALVACIGGHRPDEHPPRQEFGRPGQTSS
ncbi:hypothetical protein ACIRO3_10215 [Streptomyces sp. NPDC102278]|uniref:hypothetical protein n=1 Tax=Streptomyces sp. NPDC102278 TaxID=3366152 RepID=UPI00381D8671